MTNPFQGGQRDPTDPCKHTGKCHHFHPYYTLINILSLILKNDRPWDDGTLRSVYLLAFLLGVIDLASTSA